MKRTKRACKLCGEQFYGGTDALYCQKCGQTVRSENVIRERVCIDCGVTFPGGPRARRCPICREYVRTHAPHRPVSRHLGDIDICAWCGSEYIVMHARQKYCSEKCQKESVLDWQRKHKKGYAQKPEQIAARKERRKSKMKICVYCGRNFWSNMPTNLCSDYCRSEQQKYHFAIADINRGKNRDIDKYIDKRERYREKIKKEQNEN